MAEALSPAEIDLVDAYRRAAHFLSVGQIYRATIRCCGTLAAENGGGGERLSRGDLRRILSQRLTGPGEAQGPLLAVFLFRRGDCCTRLPMNRPLTSGFRLF